MDEINGWTMFFNKSTWKDKALLQDIQSCLGVGKFYKQGSQSIKSWINKRF